MKIILDIESRSECDIKKAGAYNYATHPSTEILMIGYKIDDDPVQMWFPGDELPEEFSLAETVFAAFNVFFEYNMLKYCKNSPFKDLKLFDVSRWRDIQALAARYGFHIKLELALKNAGFDEGKKASGSSLIKKFCIPPYETPSGPEWQEFIDYCRQDVQKEYDFMKSMPKDDLEPQEQKYWEHSLIVNNRGVPVDVDSAMVIRDMADECGRSVNDQITALTHGEVTTVKQLQRIKAYCARYGVDVPDMSSDVLERMLAEGGLPDPVKEVLQLRYENSTSSVAKYTRLLELETNGRIMNNQIYYGAHTGRFTGSGFQMFNLPRAKVDNPEEMIELINKDVGLVENKMYVGKALIRPMLCAPAGSTLYVADYKSIEYVLSMWGCGDIEALERFASGFDAYKDLAATMYHISYEDVQKNQRQFGKIGILGCGYQMGWKKLIVSALKMYGIVLSGDEAKLIVETFRTRYNRLVQLWYDLNTASLQCVLNPGHMFEVAREETGAIFQFYTCRDRTGRPWMTVRLPSGRYMMYREPEVVKGEYGYNVTYIGRYGQMCVRVFLSPGKITENVIQALGRDILLTNLLKLEEKGYEIIGSIYDEAICERPKSLVSDEDFQRFQDVFCSAMPWNKGFKIPLMSDGYISQRYKKD